MGRPRLRRYGTESLRYRSNASRPPVEDIDAAMDGLAERDDVTVLTPADERGRPDSGRDLRILSCDAGTILGVPEN